jgi:hypothetical protein
MAVAKFHHISSDVNHQVWLDSFSESINYLKSPKDVRNITRTSYIADCIGNFNSCFDIVCAYLVRTELNSSPSGWEMELNHLPKNKYSKFYSEEEIKALAEIPYLNVYIKKERRTFEQLNLFIGSELSTNNYIAKSNKRYGVSFKDCFDSITEYTKYRLLNMPDTI